MRDGLYVDASSMTKLYVEEIDSARTRELLAADPRWITARHTFVEVSRALDRAFSGVERAEANRDFLEHWGEVTIVDIDGPLCSLAAGLGQQTNTRTLDALHLAAMWRAGGPALTMVTHDERLAGACRFLGFPLADTGV